MPTDAADIYCTLHKNGTGTLLARVVGATGTPITRTDIASASYSVYLLDEQDPDSRTPVSGHSAVALTTANIIFNTLQTDPIWTKDDVGYNFKHTVELDAHQAFAVAGRRYLVEYRLMPASGQVIVLRFRVNVI